MFSVDDFLHIAPYSLDRQAKERMLGTALWDLTHYHREHCEAYDSILRNLAIVEDGSVSSVPFLPVPLFKAAELRSVPQEQVFKTLTSSGTTGQAVSRIFLDRDTSVLQQKVLVSIVSSFTGMSRMPMLIIDSPSVIKNRLMFSARGAGILGFSIFGADRTYALDDGMNIDFKAIDSFLERHAGQKILLFGFTFMIWQYFYKELVNAATSGRRIDLSRGILIHGGGWKKLIGEAVSPIEFRDRLTDVCGLWDVHDYYGMVEQTGTVYMQCEEGHLHAPIFSDVLIRRGSDFSLCDNGEKGIIQVVSMLPRSYPGHSLLTQDEGIILGEDDCPCGRKGKYFKVLGRLKNAEIRGCSDTFERK